MTSVNGLTADSAPSPFKFDPDKNIGGPPDGSGGFTNGARAERGEASSRVAPDFTTSDPHTSAQDAISDIFHYLDREGCDVNEVLRSAINNWKAER